MDNSTRGKKRRKWPYILVGVLVVVGVGIGLVVRSVSRNIKAVMSQLNNTATVERGSIQNTVYGSGVIQPGDNNILYAPADGLVEDLKVKNGDQVKKGQVLAVLSSDALDASITKLEGDIDTLERQIMTLRSVKGSGKITTPVEGRVKEIYAQPGSLVSGVMDDKGALCVLSGDGKMKVHFTPSKDVAVGQSITAAVGDEKADGVIVAVNESGADAEVYDDTFAVGAQANIADEGGSTLGSGTLEVNKPVLITGDNGSIDEVKVELNDEVKRNATLFTLSEADYSPDYLELLDQRDQDIRDLEDQKAKRDLLEVKAPCDGIVDGLKLEEKGKVLENQTMCSVDNVDDFKMEVKIDELDIAGVAVGQNATIKVTAFDYRSFPATVERIGFVGTSENGVTTYPVTLRIQKQDGLVAGMSASADILVAQKDDTLTIPISALKVDGDRTYVTKVILPEGQKEGQQAEMSKALAASRGQTQDVDVQIGVVNSTHVEILSGLSEGDTVQVVKNDSDTLSFMMGGGRNNDNGSNGQNGQKQNGQGSQSNQNNQSSQQNAASQGSTADD